MIWNLLSDIAGGGDPPLNTTPDPDNHTAIIIGVVIAAVIFSILMGVILFLSLHFKKESRQTREEITRLQEPEQDRVQEEGFTLSEEEKQLILKHRSKSELDDTEKPT